MQFILIVLMMPLSPMGFAQAVLFFTSFFTLLTNVLIAAAATSLAARDGAYFSQPRVAIALAVYITIVSAVYVLVLSSLWNPKGWVLVVDLLVHKAVPVAYVAAWAVFIPKGTLRPRNTLPWLIYPAVYGAWIGVLGAITGSYPYPSIDVMRIGYWRAFLNVLIFVGIFCAVGLAFVGIDFLMGAFRRDENNVY